MTDLLGPMTYLAEIGTDPSARSTWPRRHAERPGGGATRRDEGDVSTKAVPDALSSRATCNSPAPSRKSWDRSSDAHHELTSLLLRNPGLSTGPAEVLPDRKRGSPGAASECFDPVAIVPISVGEPYPPFAPSLVLCARPSVTARLRLRVAARALVSALSGEADDGVEMPVPPQEGVSSSRHPGGLGRLAAPRIRIESSCDAGGGDHRARGT
jgi:hypothetical protein